MLLVAGAQDLAVAQPALSLAVLAQGQVVAAERLGRLDLARPGAAEPLHRAPPGLQFRHFLGAHHEKGSGLVPQAASEINPSAREPMPWGPRRRAGPAPACWPTKTPRGEARHCPPSPGAGPPAEAGPA